MAIFQGDNVKIHQAQMKEWLEGSMKNHFYTQISTSESRP